MNLVIVESPAKAKTIEKYLGKDYKVLATIGHIIDLPKNKIAVNVEKDYEPEFVVMADKKKVISGLKKAIPKDGSVYLAMDPDREGEAIAYHTAQALKLKSPLRITFHEITKNAVNTAIANPRDVDMELVNAQFARRVLDRLVGYKVSQLLWKKIRYGLSAGRVQSVALKLIVEREEEINNFQPKEFWEIFANLAKSKDKIKTKLVSINGKKPSIKDNVSADDVEKEIGKKTFEVTDVKISDKSLHAFPPYTTSTLQQSGNNVLGLSAKRTMQLAQLLYQKGYITYMRTDSVNFSQEAVASIRDYIGKKLGEKYLPKDANYYKNKSRNAQEAHEAIRPTDIFKTANDLTEVTPQEKKLYELIWKRSLASQMSSFLAKVYTVSFTPEGLSKYVFQAQAQSTVFNGFREIWNFNIMEAEDVQEIKDIKKGEIYDLKSLEKLQKFTKPKSRYTEATLVKMLEKLGVGRPSTYATIISTVQERGYVEKEEKKLKPTDVGAIVNKFLTENFSRMVDYAYTASVEEKLDLIAEGKEKYVPVIDKEYKPLVKELESADKKVKKEDLVILEKSEEKCPECGAEMVVRVGRYGKFLSCSRFPECKGMKSMENSTVELDMEKYVKPDACPKCGKGMMVKTGKYGTYWACETYPACKGSVPLLLQEKCPDCGKNLVERKGRWGKTFIGCSGYPDCKYIKKSK